MQLPGSTAWCCLLTPAHVPQEHRAWTLLGEVCGDVTTEAECLQSSRSGSTGEGHVWLIANTNPASGAPLLWLSLRLDCATSGVCIHPWSTFLSAKAKVYINILLHGAQYSGDIECTSISAVAASF